MNPSTIQCLHGTLSCTRIIILNEPIVIALGLLLRTVSSHILLHSIVDLCTPYVFVRNDLNTLDMTRSFEDLFQDILSDARIESPDIKSSLVRLGGRTTNEPAAS